MNGVRVVGFDVSGSSALGFSGDWAGYETFLLRGDFDVAMNYHSAVWTTDLCLPLLGNGISYPVIFATCGFQSLGRPSHEQYFRRLPPYLEKCAALVFHSATTPDAEFCAARGFQNSIVVPNGVAREEFDTAPSAFRAKYGIGGRHLVLAVSNHYRYKGHDHLFLLAEQLGSNAVVCLIGEPTEDGCFAECAAKATKSELRLLHGLERSDVVAAFCEADVFVHTSDIECAPLVILESMAAGTPWVSLDAGNVAELPGGIVCREMGELTDAVVRLLDNADARSRLGGEGRGATRHILDWDLIVSKYEQVFLWAAEALPECPASQLA
jgi:glycosyltransferase involved in cell wall biosynthesis